MRTTPKFQETFQAVNAEWIISLFSSTTFSGHGLGTLVGAQEGSLHLHCWLSIYKFWSKAPCALQFKAVP